jgi:hypothetical protein
MAHCSIVDVKRDALAVAAATFKENAKSVELKNNGAVISFGKNYQVKNYNEAFEMAKRKLGLVEDWAAEKFGEKFRYGWVQISQTPNDKVRVSFTFPSNLYEAYQIKKGEFDRDLEYFQGDEQLMAQEMYQQKATDEAANKEIDDEIKGWLNKVGIEYKSVDKIYNVSGVEIDAVAKASIFNGLIEVIEGKKDIKTLPEEAGHFLVELLGDEHPVVKTMMANITGYKVYQDVLNSPYAELYKGDDTLIRKEAVGKLIAEVIVGIEEGAELPSKIARANNWFDLIWKWITSRLKRLIGSEVHSDLESYITSAKMILEGDVRGLKKIDELKSPYASKDVFYEIDNNAKSTILDKIKGMGISYDAVTKKYFFAGKEVRFRVTDFVKNFEKAKYRNQRDTEMSPEAKMLAKGGVVGHKYIQILMQELVDKDMTLQQVKGYLPNYTEIKTKVISDLKLLPDFTKDAEVVGDLSAKDYVELVNGVNKLYTKILTQQEQINKETGTEGKASILLEQVVYNGKDTGGTIDMLVLFSNGKASVYDFKGQRFWTKDKHTEDFKISKIESGTIQMQNYIKILREVYGISEKNFIETRLLPFNLNVNNTTGKVSKLEFGTTKANGEYREYLEDVPVADELTGDKTIDEQLQKMFLLRKTLESQIKSNPRDTVLKGKLERITKSIRKLQVLQESKYAYTEVNSIIKDFNLRMTRPDGNVEGVTLDYLLDTKQYLEVYQDFFRKAQKTELKKLVEQEDIDMMAKNYNAINSAISTVLEDINIKTRMIVSEETGRDYDKLSKEVGMVGTLFNRLSEFSREQFKALSDIVYKRERYVREHLNEVQSKLEKVEKDLEAWSKSKGHDLTWGINQLLNPKTGNLQGRLNETFFKEKEEAVKNKNFKWFGENTNLNYDNGKFSYKNAEDNKRFEEIKKKFLADINRTYPGESNAKERDKKIKYFEERHDILVNPNAVLFAPYYVRPAENERFYSELQKVMIKPENKSLKDAYESLENYNKEFAKLTGRDIKPGFIAEIQSGMVESLGNWRVGLDAIGNNIKTAFITREQDVLQGSRNPVTGEIIPTIPLLFTDELKINLSESEMEAIANDLKAQGLEEGSLEYERKLDYLISKASREKGVLLKSKDIFKSTYLFAQSAYTYAYTKDVESLVKVLRSTLEQSETEITDTAGKKVVNKFTGMIAKIAKVPSGELEAFDKFVRMYIYGQRIQNKDYTTGGVSVNKTIHQAMRYTSLKALGLSWITGFGNLVGTTQNMMMMASEGKYFNKTHIHEAMKMLWGERKDNSMAILRYISPYAQNVAYTEANKLSKSWGTKNVNEDLFYILMKKPDEAVDALVALGVIQQFGINENGQLRKVTDESKSILHTLTVKDGKVEGLNEEQYIQLRKLIQTAANKIKGSIPAEDQNLIGTNIYTSMLMQFKNWMPGLVKNRFAELNYDETIDELEVGRFRVLFGEFTQKGILPKLEAFGKLAAEVGSFGFYNRYNNPKDLTIAKKYYEKFLEQNPELRDKVTIDDFIELRRAKLQGMAQEVRTLLILYAIVAMIASAQPDDDEDKVQNFLADNGYRFMNRGLLEIAFFFNPATVKQIAGQPLPLLKTVTELQNFLVNTVDEGRDLITGEDYKGILPWRWELDKNDKTPLMYYSSKMIPGARGATDIFDFFNTFNNYIKK